MKKYYFFMLVLLIVGISAVYAQTNQPLTAGQVFTANMTYGAVHTYRVQLGTAPVYIIAWEDIDNSASSGCADIVVGVRHETSFFGGGVDVSDSGNFGTNMHRLMDIKNPALYSMGEGFIQNNWYIIEVRGLGNSTGTYKIVFF